MSSGAVPRHFCYVVLCHDDAAAALSLARVLRRSSPGASVLLRHDRPAGYIDEEAAAAAGAALLHSDIRVGWGDWTLVEAMLEAAAHAVRELRASHVVLVSGRDRPVRDLQAWQDDVGESGADAVLDVDGDPDPARWTYRWRTWTPSSRSPRLASRAARRAWQRGPARWQRRVVAYPTSRPGVWAVGLRRREDPVAALGLTYTKASQWMVLSAAAVGAVTAVGTARAREVFSETRIPDESYIQTVVRSDPDLAVVHGPTTYAVFPPGSASPRMARVEDVTAARGVGAAFVRKVSSDPAHTEVIAACDAEALPDR